MKTENLQIKSTWQGLKKAILGLTNLLGEDISENTILEKFQVLKQYLDYLLESLFEELDILDYCLSFFKNQLLVLYITLPRNFSWLMRAYTRRQACTSPGIPPTFNGKS